MDDFIVSGSRDGTLRVWNLATGECLHLLQGHTASVRCLSLGPKEGTIVSGSYDHTCRLWNLLTGECLGVFEGHSSKVYAVTSTRGEIFSGSLDGTVRVWDAESGECCKVFEGHRSLVGLVQAKENLMKNVVITGSTDGSLQIIKKKTKKKMTATTTALESEFEDYETAILPSAHPSSITSLDFNRNFLVTGSEGVVRLWSFESDRIEPCLLANLIENLDMVWRVAVNDNLAVIAYQVQGQTRLAIFNFAPQPQQVLIEMRAFKHNSNYNTLNSNTSNYNNSNSNTSNYNNSNFYPQQPSKPFLNGSTIPHQHIQQPQHQQGFFMSITTSVAENVPPLCQDVTMTEESAHHPELLVLGMASQSLVEHADDLIFTE